MPALKQQAIFEDTFFGMDRRLDPDKIGDGYSPLAVNVDLARLKTVRKRQGQTLLGTAKIGNFPIQSIIEYIRTDSEPEIHAVISGSLFKYDKVAKSWTTLNSGCFPSKKQVQSVQFKNRIYHVSIEDNLQWEDGTVATPTTVNGSVKAKCMAVGQRTLFIGGVTFGGVSYPSRVYYSRFDVIAGVSTDVFWESTETGFADSTRFFDVEGGQVQAITSFGNRNRVYVFSDTKCYAFDIDQVETNPFGALVEVFPIGCCGAKAIYGTDAMLYWMDKLGKIWGWSGNTTRPEELSYIIDDENLGSSVISKIDKTVGNMSQISAFGLGKRIYFNVGSIQLDNVSLPNCAIKLSLSQNGLRANFSLDTFQDRLLNGCVVTLDTGKYLAVGNSSNVLLLNNGLNDIDKQGAEVAIDSYYRTKSYHFNSPFTEKQVNTMMVKYRPTLIDPCYLQVKMSLDSDNNWQTITDPTEAVARFGIVNMYNEKATKQQVTATLNIPNEYKGLTFAFEFGNAKKDQSYEISMWGTDNWTINDPNIAKK
jgi:hypothetical protein